MPAARPGALVYVGGQLGRPEGHTSPSAAAAGEGFPRRRRLLGNFDGDWGEYTSGSASGSVRTRA